MTDDSLDETWVKRTQRRRRLWRMALVVVALLAFGYWLSPYVAVGRFALAANAGDTGTVLQRIDATSLRASFSRQIARAYLARNPQTRDLDPLSRQVATSVASGYVSALIAEHLTPEIIAELVSGRRNAGVPGDLLGAGVALPRGGGLGQVWELFTASGFTGPASFAVEPGEAAQSERYRLNFGLGQGTWLLRSVDLPQAVLGRLADDLKARAERQG